ncbi:MAG: single-stranded DNA-binding protein [Streptomycetaceae bacterium]|nr:single-stranded DNA-binding protein [Streptomycetaceae bacterium]NUS56307.1 single-stranded DNA-binding protein [Streptomycetaceae bacterium]
MFDTQVTLVGNVVSDVRSATTLSGIPLATFRMAVAPRRYDRDTNQWTQGESTFYTVAAWRRLAEHTLCSIDKGDPVVVTGKLRARAWQRDDRRHTSVEVEATALGHDLTRGTSVFTRTRRPDPELETPPETTAIRLAEPPEPAEPSTQAA